MIVHQLILLFSLILCGYIVNKVGILDSISNQKISRFIINITIPATIINASIGHKIENLNNVISVFAIAIIFYVIVPFISKACCKIIKKDVIFELMLTYSNLGFMGIPIISSIYGEHIVFYVTIFMMIFNVSIFSHGIFILANSNKKRGKIFKWIDLFNPGILCSIIALIIFIFQIPVQSDIKNLLSSVGSITTPLAMIVIGSILAEIPLSNVFSDKRMYSFSFFKLVICPLLTYIILRIFISDNVILGVTVILASLPTAGNVSMVCSEYGGDIRTVSKGICISTLLSILAIPIWIFIVT